MKLVPTSLLACATLLPVLAPAGTHTERSYLKLGRSLLLSGEQEAELQASLASAKARCHAPPSGLVAFLNLVVNEVYPTTGIPPTAIVGAFLVRNGVRASSIHEGQVTVEALRARPETPDSALSGEDRTIEVEIACTPIS